MSKNQIITGIAVITVIVITAIVVSWLLSLSAPAPFEEKITSLTIDGPDSIEVGESVSYEAILDGEVCLVGFPEVTWEIRGGQIISNNGSSVTLMTHQPGEMTLMVKFSGMTAQKVIQVHPRAEVSLDMETWIHPGQWYSTGVSFSGTTNPSLILYRLLETGRMVEVSPSIWESYGSSEIVIHENGNYVLVVEGKALSDGRVVREEKDLTVTPYVQRDYHQFSWDNENLVQLTPADKVAIQLFLEEELGVPEVDLLSEGKLRDVNRIASDYVFYKDSSRGDTLLYQTGVKSEGTTTRHVLQSSIKGSDARYVYICWDDFIVSANIGNPGVSFVDPTSGGGDSGSSGGGSSLPPPIGGGPSPSPPIGGEGPSPPPSV